MKCGQTRPNQLQNYRVIQQHHSVPKKETVCDSSAGADYPPMKVLEFETKELLKGRGILVPAGRLAVSAEEAASVAKDIGGPVVVKAQIPMARRLKAGGIRFAASSEEASAATRELLGSTVLGFRVNHVLVEERIATQTEAFLGVAYDADSRSAVVLGSRSGGTDVEASQAVVRRSFSVKDPLPNEFGRELARDLGFGDQQAGPPASLAMTLARCFVDWDALTLELNPVALDSQGEWTALDAHLEMDDDAAYRQQELLTRLPLSAKLSDTRSEFERAAARIDSADHRGVAGRLIGFDGNLGLLIGGGGASLTAMDAILDAGLKPANYCEIGGNPSVWKIKELTKLILARPRVEKLAIIMNVVSNTRVDLVARGVIKGVLELGLDPRKIIAAFRIPGSWEEEGKAILRHYGVEFLGRETGIDKAVERIRCQS